MPQGPRLPRLLFCLGRGAAAALAGVVLLAPWLDGGGEAPGGWARVTALFARDAALRHTSLASALGLLVTAYVFFQPAPPAPPGPRRPPSSGGAGA